MAARRDEGAGGDRPRRRNVIREAESERGESLGRVVPELQLGGSESHQRASFSDPIAVGDPDGVAGERPVPGRGE